MTVGHDEKERWGERVQHKRKRDRVRVPHERKEAMGIRVKHEKNSHGMRVDYERKSDGVMNLP